MEWIWRIWRLNRKDIIICWRMKWTKISFLIHYVPHSLALPCPDGCYTQQIHRPPTYRCKSYEYQITSTSTQWHSVRAILHEYADDGMGGKDRTELTSVTYNFRMDPIQGTFLSLVLVGGIHQQSIQPSLSIYSPHGRYVSIYLSTATTNMSMKRNKKKKRIRNNRQTGKHPANGTN